MIRAFSIFTILFISSIASAFIPKSTLILEKTADNHGSGVYLVEQEVQFPSGQDVFSLKETWWVDGENNLRVWVTGLRELKDQISFGFTYVNGQRSNGTQTTRLNDDFVERYFHARKTDSLAGWLIQMKILPGNALVKKSLRSSKEVEYQPESYVRLSRVGGGIAYLLGTPSSSASQQNPGVWIEQDQFVIRKLRLPSQVEVTADKYGQYSRGLWFPKARQIKWNDKTVSIQVLTVSAKGKDIFQTYPQKMTSKTDGLQNLPAKSLVEEFYQRFR